MNWINNNYFGLLIIPIVAMGVVMLFLLIENIRQAWKDIFKDKKNSKARKEFEKNNQNKDTSTTHE